ncbi:hypothetical protein [Bufonid herpesvirus 1]|uniref:hypothetical protein n=1 Tax=Bufonid herpesvirus 1 TaxID=2282206 RepID=UPI000EB715E3|nr:hypothetical protein [Bufonid herpesvirus 1]AXF48609.1 hypothetical protein [Bufonid herpesvirus 1]
MSTPPYVLKKMALSVSESSYNSSAVVGFATLFSGLNCDGSYSICIFCLNSVSLLRNVLYSPDPKEKVASSLPNKSLARQTFKLDTLFTLLSRVVMNPGVLPSLSMYT